MTTDAMDADAAAELREVHRREGKVEALRGVDLQLRPGELVALLGPNEAGKTTAVSILLGQRRPGTGSARLFGRDPTLPAARRPVGARPRRSSSPTTSRPGGGRSGPHTAPAMVSAADGPRERHPRV